MREFSSAAAVRGGVIALRLVIVCVIGIIVDGAQAATIASQRNVYAFGFDPAAVVIDSHVHDQGSLYLWEYTVTNNSYDPIPGTTNGFSGFELALPGGFPPDLGNVTSPSASWLSNCCSGLPMEWDIPIGFGLGIMPGETGVFSFTTLPRVIQTADDGWFHTWDFEAQEFITYYGAENAPLAPNLLLPPPPVPEPALSHLILAAALGYRLLRSSPLTTWRRNRT